MSVVASSASVEVPRTARWGRAALLGFLAVAVAAIGALAFRNGARASSRALDDFAEEQATQATSVAADLGTRLALAQHDAGLAVSPQQLLAGLARVTRPGESELLVRAPGSSVFVTTNGQSLPAPRLARAFEEHLRTLKLERPEALALGLPPGLAIAGIATVDAGSLGRWDVAVVATALRQGDRERTAARLVLSILFATGLLGALGGLALRKQLQGRAAARLTLASGAAHALARGGAPPLQLVPPGAVISSAMALVEHRFAQAGVQLGATAPEGLPAVACEPRLLEHALVNMLLNACDACPRGGRVQLSAERGGQSLRFIVVDDGTGITVAEAAQVTELSFNTRPAGKGTGLGLAIVGEIARSHRGSFSLTPAQPRGTRACIEIPLAVVATEPDRPVAIATRSTIGTADHR